MIDEKKKYQIPGLCLLGKTSAQGGCISGSTADASGGCTNGGDVGSACANGTTPGDEIPCYSGSGVSEEVAYCVAGDNPDEGSADSNCLTGGATS
ncbi:MAG: hypothetical protein HQ564_00100 [Candidatus Saganbacteria bacterium]|nr:hypothetical protein [Candidatus Saganbacteria bacterium]